jgi:hypothetical protein
MAGPPVLTRDSGFKATAAKVPQAGAASSSRNAAGNCGRVAVGKSSRRARAVAFGEKSRHRAGRARSNRGGAKT